MIKEMHMAAFSSHLNLMAALFKFEPSGAWLDAYWTCLKHLSLDDFRAAVDAAMTSEKFLPVPATILERVPGAAMNAAESWGRIRGLIRKHGWIGEAKAHAELTPAERVAVKGLGQWSDLCSTDPDQMDHKFRIYRELFSGAERRIKCTPQAPAIEGKKAQRGKIIDIRDLIKDLASGVANDTWPTKEAKEAKK